MIEISTGTTEEQVIKLLQKLYPVTIADLEEHLHLSQAVLKRTLQKLQIQGIVQLEPLPDKTFIRLLRQDFRFVGKKRQRKFLKHSTGKKKQEPEEYDGMMFS